MIATNGQAKMEWAAVIPEGIVNNNYYQKQQRQQQLRLRLLLRRLLLLLLLLLLTIPSGITAAPSILACLFVAIRHWLEPHLSWSNMYCRCSQDLSEGSSWPFWVYLGAIFAVKLIEGRLWGVRNHFGWT